MFGIVLKKIIKNKWMSLCMLAGSILTIAMLSCIPIYTRSVLERMVVKNLDITQGETNVYSGAFQVSAKILSGSDPDPAGTVESYDARITDFADNSVGLPVLAQSKAYITKKLLVYPLEDTEMSKANDSIGMSVGYMPSLEDHITITSGRMCQDTDDGTVEIIMTAAALADTKLLIGKEYQLNEARWMRLEGAPGTKIRVVGAFTMADTSDLYWFDGGVDNFGRCAFTTEEAFNTVGLSEDYPYISQVVWYYAYDYSKLTIDQGMKILDSYQKINSWFSSNGQTFTTNFPMYTELASYSSRETELNRTLIIIEVPILLLLAFYIYMVSGLMVDLEANEISVLKSRGASSWHIFFIYLTQGLIFSAISIIIGPLIGFGVCYMLGGANGFLEFVNRKALPVTLTGTAYIYALAAIAFFLITMLIPAIKASRQTIVVHKQNVARAHHKPIWEKLFLDFILLGVAVYGLYDYSNKSSILANITVTSEDSMIDPLMLLICTAFILGAGLLFLRLFPYLVRFVFWIGKRFWPPAFYLSLTQVGRSGGQEQFLMLFLVFTISVGIFTSNSARTININQEDNVKYLAGADIVIRNEWKQNYAVASSATGGLTSYIEVPIDDYEELDGVEAAAKVFKYTGEGVYVNSQKTGYISNVNVMAIDGDSFAKTAWMRNGLLPYHWYNYCNLLTQDKNAVLVSRAFAKKNELAVGDYITMGLGVGSSVSNLLVYAVVDYWPSMDPNAVDEDGNTNPYFIVMNFDRLFYDIPMQPYEIWLKKADGVTSNHIYEQIVEKGLQMDERTDMTEDLVSLKNDPMLQGLNGTFTLCFIASLIVCFVGFLIYWILSIKKRQLQFGIIRAMGLSMKSIISMLVVEQFLISGTAIAAGIGIGTLASYYYIPLYSLTGSSAQLTLPFRVISETGDYVRLYIVLAFILVIGFIVLARLISSIKINQALKLGED